MTENQKRTLDKLCEMQREFARIYKADLQDGSYVGLCNIDDEKVLLLPGNLRKIFGEQVKTLERVPGKRYIYIGTEYKGVKFTAVVEAADDEI